MGKSLTQKEVNMLVDGTKVMVTWSGGNGPHTYILRHRFGMPCAYHPREPVFVGVLDMVGERPLTQVWLEAHDAGRKGGG